jgi:septal ring-binding cell division protein DamX
MNANETANLNDIRERLTHLVSFGNHVILISQNKAADQQTLVQTLLADVGDTTEFAFLTARQGQDLSVYRNDVFKQLVGDLPDASIKLPHIFSLHEFTGRSVLLVINQADKLPDLLLSEIEVMHIQAKQASVSLKIVLVGNTEWLPHARNLLLAASPVVLHIDETPEHAVSIDTPAKKAVTRQKKTGNKNLLAIWVILLGAMLGAATYWFLLYKDSELLNNLINKLTISSSVNTDQKLPAQNHEKTPEMSNEQVLDESKLAENETGSPQLSNESVIESDLLSEEDPTAHLFTQAADDEEEVNLSDPSSPVSTWRQQSDALNGSAAEQTIDDELSDSSLNQIEQRLNEVLADQSSPEQETLEDLPPISTVDTLEANFVNAEYDNPRVLALPESTLFIQLSAADSPESAMQFRNRLPEDYPVWIVKGQGKGKVWYFVLSQQTFNNIQAARAGLDALPDNIKVYQPFIKSYATLNPTQ